MGDVLRRKLIELIRQEGPGLIQERARLEGMLWLAIGDHCSGMFALMGALERHIPQAIHTAPPERRNPELFDKLIRRLVTDLDVDEETAQWAVESWHLAVYYFPQQTPPPAPRTEAKPDPLPMPPRRLPPPAPSPENIAGVPLLSLDGPDLPAQGVPPLAPFPNPVAPAPIEMGLDPTVFRGHQDAVTCLACSPDGRLIVTGSADRTLILWDANGTKRAVLSCKDRVVAVAFAPDSRLLASASADGSIQLWDARRGQAQNLLPCARGWPTALAFAPDGSKLLAGGKDGTALLWRLEDSRTIHSLAGHRDELLAVAFSPTGLSLATAGEDGRARLWDVVRGRPWANLSGHHEAVTGVAFSHDGKLLATVSRDGIVKLWNAVTGREIAQLEVDRQQFSEVLRCVAFAPDGRTLAAGAEDDSVHVWDVASCHQLASFSDCGGPVAGIAFTPDGRWLLAAGADGLVRRWQAPLARRLPLYENPIRRPGLKANRSGRNVGAIGGVICIILFIIVAVSVSGFLNKNWRNRNNNVPFPPNNPPRAQIPQEWQGQPRNWFGHAGGVASVAVSPDGHRILSGGFDHMVRLWNIHDNRELVCLGGLHNGHTAPVLAVAFSPDGTRALSASLDRTVILWDLTTYRQIRSYPHDTGVTSVAFSNDGKRFVSGCGFDQVIYTHKKLPQEREQLQWTRPSRRPGAVYAWQVDTGVLTRLPMPPGCDQISSVTFSADDDQIIGGCFDKTLLVWDAKNYKRLHQLPGHKGEVFSVAAVPNPLGFPNFNKVVSGATKLGKPDQLKKDNPQQLDQFPFRVWDLQTGQEERQFPAHARGILSVAVSPDGNRVLTTGFDSMVFLWDLNTGQKLREFQSQGLVNCVTFSPDGRFAVWGSWDGTVQVWRLQG